MQQIDTAIITGWISPFLKWHADLAAQLLDKHHSVTYCLLTKIEDPLKREWPTFSKPDKECFLSLWERVELIRRGLADNVKIPQGRVVNVPMYVWNREIYFNRTFFPPSR